MDADEDAFSDDSGAYMEDIMMLRANQRESEVSQGLGGGGTGSGGGGGGASSMEEVEEEEEEGEQEEEFSEPGEDTLVDDETTLAEVGLWRAGRPAGRPHSVIACRCALFI